MASTTYTYGDLDGNLIFVESGMARQLVTLRSAFSSWGDARAALEPTAWAEIVGVLSKSDVDLPGDDEPFDLELVPGYSDGDWPAWPAQLMLTEIPREVAEKYGRVEDSVLNGQYLHLDATYETEILRDLRAQGWDCVRDDALVQRASGY